MMLVASPALAQSGSKYHKNYYPEGYYNYCHEKGEHYYGDKDAEKYCYQYYTDYKKKTADGKKYYYVHVYYKWYDEDEDKWYKKDYWYYCHYKKYYDEDEDEYYFKCYVCYKEDDGHKKKCYWEYFYPYDPDEDPHDKGGDDHNNDH